MFFWYKHQTVKKMNKKIQYQQIIMWKSHVICVLILWCHRFYGCVVFRVSKFPKLCGRSLEFVIDLLLIWWIFSFKIGGIRKWFDIKPANFLFLLAQIIFHLKPPFCIPFPLYSKNSFTIAWFPIIHVFLILACFETSDLDSRKYWKKNSLRENTFPIAWSELLFHQCSNKFTENFINSVFYNKFHDFLVQFYFYVSLCNGLKIGLLDLGRILWFTFVMMCFSVI